ncbi:MAG: helix-turn-helix transcriptional regulator [Oscillospiraceae bacterium]|nr:helix-turn-helix transcriptional regulator [Oscillospiraceae bacterium]
MNIEIANRLHQLRKMNNLSQEELAEKIGISRQAVSKWERAESSPDTGNLILLSKLYGVSIDEMLKTEPNPHHSEAVSLKKDYYAKNSSTSQPHVPLTQSNDGEIYPQAYHKAQSPPNHQNAYGNAVSDFEKAITEIEGVEKFANDFEKTVSKIEKGVKKAGNEIDKLVTPSKKNSPRATLADKLIPLTMATLFLVFMSFMPHSSFPLVFLLYIPLHYTTKKAKNKKDPMLFCYPVFVAAIFFALGYGLMQYTWTLFLTIPLYYTAIAAFRKRNPLIFCYPVLVTYIYCSLISLSSWFAAATWPIFLTIPFYYVIFSHIMDEKKRNGKQ